MPDTWRFSIDVAKRWEEAAADAPVRTVLMRTAMVMSPDRGGVFDTLYGLARRGLGGRAGHGRQYVSWIHDVDFARAIRRLIEDESFSGPVNLASPNPLPYAEFMRRAARRARLGLPATRWMLELGAFFMRTETELVLKSRRVVPGRLLDAGLRVRVPGVGGRGARSRQSTRLSAATVASLRDRAHLVRHAFEVDLADQLQRRAERREEVVVVRGDEHARVELREDALPVVRRHLAAGHAREEDVDGLVLQLGVVEIGAALVIERDPGDLDPDAVDRAALVRAGRERVPRPRTSADRRTGPCGRTAASSAGSA